jgi:hypothetical protein
MRQLFFQDLKWIVLWLNVQVLVDALILSAVFENGD